MQAKAASQAAGGADQLLGALDRLSAALALPAGGSAPDSGAWQPGREQAAVAALAAPRVLTMPVAAVQQRVGELEIMLKVSEGTVVAGMQT